MADMHKFPRHSVDLAQHESVVPEEQIKANKSLKKFAVVLAACALLFLGVMAVAAIAQTSKPHTYGTPTVRWDFAGEGGGVSGVPGANERKSSGDWFFSVPDGCLASTDGTCAWYRCNEDRQAECNSNHGR
jgi:hypothetical protein